MSALRLGALAYPVTAPATFTAFAEKFDGLVGEGAAGGGQLLVMPEYACMEVAAAFEGAGNVTAELDSVCAQRDSLLEVFRGAAKRHGVWLLPGSMPWKLDSHVRNRAPLISPDGKIRFQEKSVMTPVRSGAMGRGVRCAACGVRHPMGQGRHRHML